MIEKGIKKNTQIIKEVNPQNIENEVLSSKEILEIHFKLNWLQQQFKDTYIKMKKNELRDSNFEIIYYSYDQRTGKAIFQVIPDVPKAHQTALGLGTGQLITISVVAIASVFTSYFAMKSTKYIFRKREGFSWIDVASLGGFALALSKLISSNKGG